MQKSVEANLLKTLLDWCKQMTLGYQNVNVTNFTSSWRNGLAFCALMHKFNPQLIDFSSLSKDSVLENNRLAFEAGEALGVPALLDPEDMIVMPIPDKISVVTYLSTAYCRLKDRKPTGGPHVVAKNAPKRPSIVPTRRQSKIVTQKEGVTEVMDVCEFCKQRVHLIERYWIGTQLYHRNCYLKNAAVLGRKSISEDGTILPLTGSLSIPGESELRTDAMRRNSKALNEMSKRGIVGSAMPALGDIQESRTSTERPKPYAPSDGSSEVFEAEPAETDHLRLNFRSQQGVTPTSRQPQQNPTPSAYTAIPRTTPTTAPVSSTPRTAQPPPIQPVAQKQPAAFEPTRSAAPVYSTPRTAQPPLSQAVIPQKQPATFEPERIAAPVSSTPSSQPRTTPPQSQPVVVVQKQSSFNNGLVTASVSRTNVQPPSSQPAVQEPPAFNTRLAAYEDRISARSAATTGSSKPLVTDDSITSASVTRGDSFGRQNRVVTVPQTEVGTATTVPIQRITKQPVVTSTPPTIVAPISTTAVTTTRLQPVVSTVAPTTPLVTPPLGDFSAKPPSKAPAAEVVSKPVVVLPTTASITAQPKTTPVVKPSDQQLPPLPAVSPVPDENTSKEKKKHRHRDREGDESSKDKHKPRHSKDRDVSPTPSETSSVTSEKRKHKHRHREEGGEEKPKSRHSRDRDVSPTPSDTSSITGEKRKHKHRHRESEEISSTQLQTEADASKKEKPKHRHSRDRDVSPTPSDTSSVTSEKRKHKHRHREEGGEGEERKHKHKHRHSKDSKDSRSSSISSTMSEVPVEPSKPVATASQVPITITTTSRSPSDASTTSTASARLGVMKPTLTSSPSPSLSTNSSVTSDPVKRLAGSEALLLTPSSSSSTTSVSPVEGSAPQIRQVIAKLPPQQATNLPPPGQSSLITKLPATTTASQPVINTATPSKPPRSTGAGGLSASSTFSTSNNSLNSASQAPILRMQPYLPMRVPQAHSMPPAACCYSTTSNNNDDEMLLASACYF